MRKRRAARAKAKAKQAQDMKQKLKGSKTKKQKKHQKKEQKRKLLKKQKAQKIVEESAKNYRRQGVGVLLVQQQMDRARRLDNAKFPGNLIFSSDNDLCRLKIENCKEVPWSKVREAAHPYLKVVFLDCYFWLFLNVFPGCSNVSESSGILVRSWICSPNWAEVPIFERSEVVWDSFRSVFFHFFCIGKLATGQETVDAVGAGNLWLHS